MHSTGLSIMVAIALGLNGLAAQKPDVGEARPSPQGETVVVQGCASASLLRSMPEANPIRPNELQTADVYRLTGEKKLLHLIQKEHQDQLLEVTGVISRNSTATTHTKKMGRLQVSVGDGRPDPRENGKVDYPELRVTSFEVIRPNCEH
jgi:hypothetical protein